MPKLNSDSIDDAKTFVESVLPETQIRQKFINFLCDAFCYSDTINSDNWNLNLDPNGKFLRSNTDTNTAFNYMKTNYSFCGT